MAVGKSVVDDVNGGTMHDAGVVRRYGQASEVTAPERVIYARLRGELLGQPLLDLGVGGGRTVPALRALSTDYVGVDYSQAMVDSVRRRFPGVRFEHGDARALTAFGDGQFAFVLFSCNGLGMIGHADRLRCLAEVHRVLRPGGYFAFSAHNQRSPDHAAGLQLPAFELTAHPVKLGVRVARFVKHAALSAYNHRRLHVHDVRTPAYSIINDRCHDYATMLYYISLTAQRRQLEACGYAPAIEAFDLSGRALGPGADTTDSSIYYLARK